MIISICGSCTFAKKMAEAKEKLEKDGHKVFAPETLDTEECYQENHGREKFLKMKQLRLLIVKLKN